MKSVQQVMYIHGGMTFLSQEEYVTYLKTREVSLEQLRNVPDWKGNLQKVLGANYDVLVPRMPNGSNAQYGEWELWFSRILPHVDDDMILIGHSLGGAFLARYLAEHKSPVTIKATLLVAAPYRDDVPGESLGGFVPPSDLSLFKEQGGKLFIYHSTDDPVVPFTHGELYAQVLPEAVFRRSTGMGHFNVPTFPTLEEDVRALT